MKKIRLLKLNIENFRGIKDLELKFDGEDRVLAGTNEVGKTTVADAYSWLISDKDSKGNSQFEIKPLDEDNEPIHHLNTIVEGTFQILKDGKFDREFTLKKDYYEKWTRKRGTTTEEFSGHTTDYYIDDTPEKKSDYEAFIDNIIDYDTLKLISDPLYFNEQLHWKEQRDIIFNLIDRPDPGEVAAEIEKYYLAEKLENKTVEKYQEQLKAKMKKINKKLDKLPARIDENQRKLSQLDVGDKDKLESKLKDLQEQLDKLQEERATLKADSKSGTMTEIIDLKSDLQDLKEKKLKAANKRLEEYREQKRNMDSAADTYRTHISNLKNVIDMQKKRKATAEQERKELLEEYHEVDNQTFDEDDKVCSKCGQELPEDKVKEIKEEFNQKKSDKLARIKSKGKKKAKVIKKAEEKIAEALAGVEKHEERIEKLEYKEVEEGIAKGEQFKEKVKNNELPELKEIVDKIEELQDKANDNEEVDLSDINAKVNDTKKEIKSVEKALSKVEDKEKTKQRIEELQDEEQKLVNNYEQFEKQLYDLEKYIKTETKMMEEDINNKFDIAEFKLFDKQVNGAVNETCEAMKKGVPYSELNTGSQYQVGMDIIDTLSEHYDISAPIFIDNRERIARLPKTNSQTIQLVMTPEREELEMINLADEDDTTEFIKNEGGIKREKLF